MREAWSDRFSREFKHLAMVSKQVLRVPRSDSQGDYILLNVNQNGLNPLDLSLEATDGLSPYTSNIKESRMLRSLAKGSRLKDLEWKDILCHFFLPQVATSELLESSKDLDISCSINGEELLITFKKIVSGITQRLGSLGLKQDDRHEIDITSWALTAVARSVDLEKEVASLKRRYGEQGEMVKKLNHQLDDLIKAKQEHENALLWKTQELLNAKKLKIRDQQRLLAEAKIDPSIAAKVKPARPHSARHSPTSSRNLKRKSASVMKSESDDSGFEAMAVDNVNLSEPITESESETPSKSGLDATTDEDEDFGLPPTASSQRNKSNNPEQPTSSPISQDNLPANSNQPQIPPPRRDLPFAEQQKGGQSRLVASDTGQEGNATGEAAHDSDSTASDDEL